MAAVAHDIYGIGATIYCLLVGHPPRMDSGGFFVGRKNAPEDLGTTLRKLRGRVPPAEWILIVERCIALDPAKRPASVEEIMEALGLGGCIQRMVRGEATALPCRFLAKSPEMGGVLMKLIMITV